MRTLLLAGLLASSAFAQNDTAKGKKIIEQVLAGMGGQAYLNMQDRVETGRGYSFYHENLSGLDRIKLSTRYLQRPEPPQPGFVGMRERQGQGKHEERVVLFTEQECWETTYMGAKPLKADLVARWRESLLHNVLYTLRQRLGEPGLEFYYMRSEVFENQPADVVDIVDADNRTTTVWFHQSLHVPLKQLWFRRDPKTHERIDEVTIFSKYRDVGGGVQWPFVIRRERNDEIISELFMESVEINKGLTDDLFTLSANTKIIEKKPGKK